MEYRIGIVGLGVMGRSLALNMERNGFPVAGYDRDAAHAAAFLAGPAAGRRITTVADPAQLVAVLERPRRILLMVPAGAPVDDAITQLEPHLAPADILMDGGNSHFLDTERRAAALEAKGLSFLGIGVSGGEQGALRGPSIMPGGRESAWHDVAAIFTAIAARAEDGEPCVAYLGPRGAGHYVKMVHNGIEYADMQLIAEAYDLLHRGAGIPNDELAEVFAAWNAGELQSYLVEITAAILERRDAESGTSLVDLIVDEAAQKGTGKWMSQNALDVGAAIPTINAAVESRILSSMKAERVAAARVLGTRSEDGRVEHMRGGSARGAAETVPSSGYRKRLVDAAGKALLAGRITAYAQGFAQLELASAEYEYGYDYGTIARIWRAGCIIRARLLGNIMAAFQRDAALRNLMLDPALREMLASCDASWRETVQAGIAIGIPMNAMSASLAYYDAYRSERLPASLTQAQRDYFGAHTYRRIDRDGSFHTAWS
jgi:6-phosphogluconate dehydrogenase